MHKLIFFIALLLPLAGPQTQAHAAKLVKAAKPTNTAKESLVLMPVRVSEEDIALQGAMETALVEGLQQKYKVFSGEQVAKKARDIFSKESKNTAKKECDETKCMQDIAMGFQAELLAIANVTKRDGGYYLVLSIKNILDNLEVYSKTIACKNCDTFQAIEKLKELSGTTTQAAAPVAATPEAPVVTTGNPNNPENSLWSEVQKGNSADDYNAYLAQYPKGKYVALAKTRIKKLQEQEAAEAARQEQSAWESANSSASEESYTEYLGSYPRGQYVTLATARIAKLKKDAANAEATQRREQAAAEAKRKQEQAAAAERQKREAASRPTGFVSQGGLTWMPINSSGKNWSNANAYCTNTAINGQTGWRLPTRDELKALYDSGAMKGQGWTLNYTWSSTPYSSGSHYGVNLGYGNVLPGDDTSEFYVTCVR